MAGEMKGWMLGLAAVFGGSAALASASAEHSGPAVVLAAGGTAWALGAALRRRAAAPAPHTPQTKDRAGFPVGLGRALLHQMPAPLIVISQSERLVYANPAAMAILPRATVGMHYSGVIRASAFVEAVEHVFETREDTECTFAMMMERERFFEARASMLPAGAGDFGEEAHVIFQIEDRTRDKASLQARTDFVANASHELRTPLASILGYIETLQGHAKEDPEARELFLGIMMKQASRMQRLVDDLMSLSRIEMNAHVRPEERLDLHAVAAEAANALFPLATQNDVLLQVEISTDEPGPTVLGDRDQLNQVLVNLVDNAIKYGGQGQKVRVRPADPSSKYPGQAGISVIDTGPGIARENVHRLTERFFRVNAGQSRDKGGTGLGLAITKHILNRHSGALGIESQPGHGSTFTLWLPVANEADSDGNVGKIANFQ
ncbi:ATP-binding protein [Algicella marina]|uniref:histidine kinase n=1 Tax=Algicella marina TaxID=2683284 RepID=A0A6P1T2W6_9RHOB|nr:ATP-binding protein [Algicella marina]QHQ35649.1 hypothetical protein GO499_10920 [Algicella marina]